jgi:endonuclease/exonuclease/phosphatase family metal-dependent hydrolase
MIKAVTFNLYNRPWQRQARLANAATTLRAIDADIVLLQEVAQGWILPGGDPARQLAEALRMRYVRHWHEKNLGIFSTGLAILSRFPILSAEYRKFERHSFLDPKGYLLVMLELPGGLKLQLINLHMASTSDDSIRESEWAELSGFVETIRERGPVLIGGDFNTASEHPALKAFVGRHKARSLYELESFKDLSRWRTWTPSYREAIDEGAFGPGSQLIDYFFAVPGKTSGTAPAGGSDPLQFTGGRIVLPSLVPRPSDHLPVTAEIVLTLR